MGFQRSDDETAVGDSDDSDSKHDLPPKYAYLVNLEQARRRSDGILCELLPDEPMDEKRKPDELESELGTNGYIECV